MCPLLMHNHQRRCQAEPEPVRRQQQRQRQWQQQHWRRSVCTLTAAVATYTPEFSVTKPNWRWLRWRRLPAMAFAVVL